MTPRLLLAALLAALLLPATAEAKKSCTRGGATLEASSGDVRVVRRELKTQSAQETRREAVSMCWARTGERKRIALEQDFGEDLISRTSLEIVDERYVGVVETGEGGVSIGVVAAVWDARKGKRLHTSAVRCKGDDDDFRGPDDVAFLTRGGMAFACGPLWFFKNAAQKTATQLEPASAGAGRLGVASRSDSFVDRLYWTLSDGTVKTLDLL
jgi:outer membrane biogenesis lipoprotein LolB